MTTVAERLSHLSGLPLGTATMAQHLRAMVARFSLAVPAQATVAAILIAYSGLPAGTATMAQHLAVEREPLASVDQVDGSGISIRRRVRRLPAPMPIEAFDEADEELTLHMLRLH